MYEHHWQLSRRPFESGADARLFYPSEGHQAALLKLRYAIEGQRGAALLVGESGVGKTLVARLLAERLGDSIAPRAHLVYPQLPAPELLATVAHQLGAQPGHTLDQTIERLERLLIENARAGRHALLVVDEAHLLEAPRAFEALRLLLNFEHEGTPALTLLLIGQGGLVPLVDRLPPFEERLAVKCLLRSLSLDETDAYVQHRLQAAGAKQAIFTPAAIAQLHALAHGNPRRTNRLCDLALLIGYAEERSRLDAEQIDAVAGELQLLPAA